MPQHPLAGQTSEAADPRGIDPMTVGDAAEQAAALPAGIASEVALAKGFGALAGMGRRARTTSKVMGGAKNAGSFIAAYQEAQAHHLKAAMGKAGLNPADPKQLQQFVRDYPDQARQAAGNALLEAATLQLTGPAAKSVLGGLQARFKEAFEVAGQQALDAAIQSSGRTRIPND